MSSKKQSKIIFIGLTLIGLGFLFAMFSRINPEVMPLWARVPAILFIVGIAVYFFTRTKAGKETGTDYLTGAKATYAEAQDLIAKGKEMVKNGIDEGYKLIAEGEAMLKKISDEKKE